MKPFILVALIAVALGYYLKYKDKDKLLDRSTRSPIKAYDYETIKYILNQLEQTQYQNHTIRKGNHILSINLFTSTVPADNFTYLYKQLLQCLEKENLKCIAATKSIYAVYRIGSQPPLNEPLIYINDQTPPIPKVFTNDTQTQFQEVYKFDIQYDETPSHTVKFHPQDKVRRNVPIPEESSLWPNTFSNNYQVAAVLGSGMGLVSANGYYWMIMQSDCNLVIYNNFRSIWTSDTSRSDTCTLQIFGKYLSIVNSRGQSIWNRLVADSNIYDVDLVM